MTSTLIRSTLVAAASAAIVVGAASPALSATTITPAGPMTVTATSKNLAINASGLILQCTNVSGSGQTPSAPGNVNSGTGGINIPMTTAPTLKSCNASGLPATVTTSGSWAFKMNNDSGSPSGTLVMPNGGAIVKIGGTNGCTITVNSSNIGPSPWSNALQRMTAATPVGTANSKTVINGSGSPSCPAAGPGTGTMTGTFQFASATAITVS